MKVVENAKNFFVDAGKDIETLFKSDVKPGVKKDIIASLALKAIGLVALTFAASAFVTGIAFAATPLAVVGAIILTAIIIVIAHDILTVGGNLSNQANLDNHTFGFSKKIREGFKEFVELPTYLNGTIALKPIAKAIAKAIQ